MPGEKPTANWDIAQPALQPWVDRADIVVTTEELSSLFFLGHYDVRFSPSKLGEQAPGNRDEFSRDFRTGRPIIGTNDSMRLILDCFASGVVFGPIVDWGKPHLIDEELTEIIEAEATPIALPAKSHMFAYGWEREHTLARRGRLRRHPRSAPEAAHAPALRAADPPCRRSIRCASMSSTRPCSRCPTTPTSAGRWPRQGAEVVLIGRGLRSYEQVGEHGFAFRPLFYRRSENAVDTWQTSAPRKILKGLEHVAGMRALERLAAAERPDILHLQWFVLPVVDRYFLRRIGRRAGLVLTVHDSQSFHGSKNSSWLQVLGDREARLLFDHYIVHTEQTRDTLRELGNRGQPHQHHRRIRRCRWPRRGAASAAGSRPAPCAMLFFGSIKHYKGIDVLVDAGLSLAAAGVDFVIDIVGRPFEPVDELEAKIAAAGKERHFRFDLRYIPDEALTDYLQAADLVVFPYRKIDASGALALAIEAEKPIVASRHRRVRGGACAAASAAWSSPRMSTSSRGALKELIESPRAREELRQQTRQLKAGMRTWPEFAGECLAVYKRPASTASASAGRIAEQICGAASGGRRCRCCRLVAGDGCLCRSRATCETERPGPGSAGQPGTQRTLRCRAAVFAATLGRVAPRGRARRTAGAAGTAQQPVGRGRIRRPARAAADDRPVLRHERGLARGRARPGQGPAADRRRPGRSRRSGTRWPRRPGRTSAACRPGRRAAMPLARRSASGRTSLAGEVQDHDVALGDHDLAKPIVAVEARLGETRRRRRGCASVARCSGAAPARRRSRREGLGGRRRSGSSAAKPAVDGVARRRPAGLQISRRDRLAREGRVGRSACARAMCSSAVRRPSSRATPDRARAARLAVGRLASGVCRSSSSTRSRWSSVNMPAVDPGWRRRRTRRPAPWACRPRPRARSSPGARRVREAGDIGQEAARARARDGRPASSRR